MVFGFASASSKATMGEGVEMIAFVLETVYVERME
jgi:hypothetical protein